MDHIQQSGYIRKHLQSRQMTMSGHAGGWGKSMGCPHCVGPSHGARDDRPAQCCHHCFPPLTPHPSLLSPDVAPELPMIHWAWCAGSAICHVTRSCGCHSTGKGGLRGRRVPGTARGKLPAPHQLGPQQPRHVGLLAVVKVLMLPGPLQAPSELYSTTLDVTESEGW